MMASGAMVRSRAMPLHSRYLATAASPPSSDVTSSLNNLIETARDSAKGFETSAQNVKSPELKKNFQEWSQQREEFTRQLQDKVSQLGAKPVDHGSAAGAIHRGWVTLKGVLSQGDKAIVNEIIRGEGVAEKAFKEAAEKKDVPADVKKVIEQQHKKIQESLDYAKKQYNSIQ
jgi:uncharacterized protein (TIGR02284 family)